MDLGHRDTFGGRTLQVPLRKGDNTIEVTLSNTRNFNHGGWAFAFVAQTAEVVRLLPAAR